MTNLNILKLVPRGTPFTDSEDKQMVQYVTQNELRFLKALSLRFWTDAEIDGVCEGRSASSLLERWRKLSVFIDKFPINSKLAEYIKQYARCGIVGRKNLQKELRVQKKDTRKKFSPEEDNAIKKFVTPERDLMRNNLHLWDQAVKMGICPGRNADSMMVRYRRIRKPRTNKPRDRSKNHTSVFSDDNDDVHSLEPLSNTRKKNLPCLESDSDTSLDEGDKMWLAAINNKLYGEEMTLEENQTSSEDDAKNNKTFKKKLAAGTKKYQKYTRLNKADKKWLWAAENKYNDIIIEENLTNVEDKEGMKRSTGGRYKKLYNDNYVMSSEEDIFPDTRKSESQQTSLGDKVVVTKELALRCLQKDKKLLGVSNSADSYGVSENLSKTSDSQLITKNSSGKNDGKSQAKVNTPEKSIPNFEKNDAAQCMTEQNIPLEERMKRGREQSPSVISLTSSPVSTIWEDCQSQIVGEQAPRFPCSQKSLSESTFPNVLAKRPSSTRSESSCSNDSTPFQSAESQLSD